MNWRKWVFPAEMPMWWYFTSAFLLGAIINTVFWVWWFAPAHAGTQAFNMDPVVGATGYKIYCGNTAGIYSPIPVATFTIGTTVAVAFSPGTYFCVATAYDATRESVVSNELSFVMAASPPPPLPLPSPQNFRLTLQVTMELDGSMIMRLVSVEKVP